VESDCDTKLYITWEGTDVKGRHLMSDNYRLSKFTDYSIMSLIDSAKRIADDTYSFFGGN